jgi:hypothetical protein
MADPSSPLATCQAVLLSGPADHGLLLVVPTLARAATYEGFATLTPDGSGQPTHRITNFNDGSFGGLRDAVSKWYRSIRYDVVPHNLPSFDRRKFIYGICRYCRLGFGSR